MSASALGIALVRTYQCVKTFADCAKLRGWSRGGVVTSEWRGEVSRGGRWRHRNVQVAKMRVKPDVALAHT